MEVEEKAKQLLILFDGNKDYAITCANEVYLTCPIEKDWYWQEIINLLKTTP